MIYLITDNKLGEPDILTPSIREVLYIKDLEGKLLSEIHPIEPWSHDALMEVAKNIEEHNVCQYGADAFLDNMGFGKVFKCLDRQLPIGTVSNG